MITPSAKWIAVMLAVALAGCTQQSVRDTPAQAAQAPQGKIDYGKYVTSTVPWFNFTSLYSWDSNQLGYVVVWTSPIQAYRLTLAGPCLGLQAAAGVIRLTSHGNLVSSNRDAVLAGGDRCSIMRIERLDAKAIKAARSDRKSGGGKDG